MACKDPRGSVGSIKFYKGEYYTLVHTTYESYGFGEEDFFKVFPMTPRARLAGFIAEFIKKTTIHCYIEIMKALGLVVSEKNIFLMFFPMTPPGRGPYGPQGHGWQDL